MAQPQAVKPPGRGAIVGMVIGAAVAVGTYVGGGGWWLDAAPRVRLTLMSLAITATVVVSVWRTHPPRELALSIWLGFVSGMTAILFAIGPGTIFPIVIFIGGAMSGAAVLVGSLVGAIVKLAVMQLER